MGLRGLSSDTKLSHLLKVIGNKQRTHCFPPTSQVLLLVYSQAIGRIHGQAGDGLGRLSTDPDQLDHQVYLVAGGLLQGGTAHPAGGEKQRQTLLRKQEELCKENKPTKTGLLRGERRFVVRLPWRDSSVWTTWREWPRMLEALAESG